MRPQPFRPLVSRSLRTMGAFTLALLLVPMASRVHAQTGGARTHLDVQALARTLKGMPEGGGTPIVLPMPDGSLQGFRMVPAPVLAPELAARYPGIATFRGRGIDAPDLMATLGLAGDRLHAVILGPGGRAEVRPVDGGAPSVYQSTWIPRESVTCSTSGLRATKRFRAQGAQAAGDLVTYDLVVSATGEYTARFSNADAAMAGIADMIAYVNAIYERDLSIRFTIVDALIFTDPDTDPYPTVDPEGSLDALLAANQDTVDAEVGDGNYDLGIVFADQEGPDTRGQAQLGGACQAGEKAQAAVVGVTPIVGDKDLIAHEIGHLFSATHTYNSSTCPQRQGETAYEPGSGSTIMGTGGCDPSERVPGVIGNYFHTASLGQILAMKAANDTCGTAGDSGNANDPTVSAGAAYTIPRDTPFTLTATGGDADGDALTYAWEQYDTGAASPPPNTVDGPLFRSFPPTASPSRTFPGWEALIAGDAPWESLPTADRELTFRVTARDNHDGGGRVAWDQVVITASGNPFRLVSPNGGETLSATNIQVVTWEVGGTAEATPTVNILFVDTDGSVLANLATATANDGQDSVLVPCPEGGVDLTGLIKLEAVGNVFFDVSDGTVTLADDTAPEVTCPGDVTVECNSHQGVAADDPLLAEFFAGFSATDNCDPEPETSLDNPDYFPLGMTVVTYTATDAAGNSAQCTATVEVVDTTPPEVSVSLNRDVLWPPNHKFYDIVAEVTVTDICDPEPVTALAAIESNEEPDGRGDGHTQPDWNGADLGEADLEFQLRAERSGTGDGRVYSVIYHGIDHSGNVGADTAYVTVPHDQRGHAMASNGFVEGGGDWAPGSRRFAIVLPSWSDQELSFDVARADVRHIQIGNTKGVVPAEAVYRGDANADGRQDLVVLYSVDAARGLHLQARGVADPTSLHLADDLGNHWVVYDILGLGAPVRVDLTELEEVDLTVPDGPAADAAQAVRRDPGYTGGTPEVAPIRQLVAAPNPLRSSRLTVTYALPEAGPVQVEVFDRQGRLVRTLVDGFGELGEHTITWNGRDGSGSRVASGIYFIRLESVATSVTSKLVVLMK